MSFRSEPDEFSFQYIRFLGAVREAIQRTFAQESELGLTQKELADTLGVDQALVSRRLHNPGNITLKTLSELYTAMGRETLSNFEVPASASKYAHTIAQSVGGCVVILDDFRSKSGTPQTTEVFVNSGCGTTSAMMV